MNLTMTVADALDYSSGRVLVALKATRGKKRDAIHLANWPDVAISLRSAIDQLPAKGTKILLAKKVVWTETKPSNDLACGLGSAIAVVGVIQDHWDKHYTDCEACDRVKGALEDADTSIRDLHAAMFDGR